MLIARDANPTRCCYCCSCRPTGRPSALCCVQLGTRQAPSTAPAAAAGLRGLPPVPCAACSWLPPSHKLWSFAPALHLQPLPPAPHLVLLLLASVLGPEVVIITQQPKAALLLVPSIVHLGLSEILLLFALCERKGRWQQPEATLPVTSVINTCHRWPGEVKVTGRQGTPERDNQAVLNRLLATRVHPHPHPLPPLTLNL